MITIILIIALAVILSFYSGYVIGYEQMRDQHYSKMQTLEIATKILRTEYDNELFDDAKNKALIKLSIMDFELILK